MLFAVLPAVEMEGFTCTQPGTFSNPPKQTRLISGDAFAPSFDLGTLTFLPDTGTSPPISGPLLPPGVQECSFSRDHYIYHQTHEWEKVLSTQKAALQQELRSFFALKESTEIEAHAEDIVLKTESVRLMQQELGHFLTQNTTQHKHVAEILAAIADYEIRLHARELKTALQILMFSENEKISFLATYALYLCDADMRNDLETNISTRTEIFPHPNMIKQAITRASALMKQSAHEHP